MKYTLASISGTFTVGETVTESVTSATGLGTGQTGDHPYQFKLTGQYILPFYDVSISANLLTQSGIAYTRQVTGIPLTAGGTAAVNVEPLGSLLRPGHLPPVEGDASERRREDHQLERLEAKGHPMAVFDGDVDAHEEPDDREENDRRPRAAGPPVAGAAGLDGHRLVVDD